MNWNRNRGGVRLVHRKDTAAVPTMELPSAAYRDHLITLPMSMHIGAPAQSVVVPGDRVCVGTLVGRAQGTVSAHVHSSVSGVVEAVEAVTLSGGRSCQAVKIRADGLQTLEPSCRPPRVENGDDLLQAVADCGLVGLGGAGFPTHVKLAARNIGCLVVNGAECEPYLTTDQRTMLEDTDDLLRGIRAVLEYRSIPRCVIAVEKNKPECIELLSQKTRDMTDVEVKALPSRYPQGAEKGLILSCTGLEVPETGPSGGPGLPADVGVLVMNVTSAAVLGCYLATGIPLTSRRLTVAGGACTQPRNIRVPIGLSLGDVIAACGSSVEQAARIVVGGPMMGVAVNSVNYPVLKQNNGLLLLTAENIAGGGEEGPCIRCGSCISACPMGLEPVEIVQAKNRGDMTALGALKAGLCVSCGCCTYVCPAKRSVSLGVAEGKATLAAWKKGGGGK